MGGEDAAPPPPPFFFSSKPEVTDGGVLFDSYAAAPRQKAHDSFHRAKVENMVVKGLTRTHTKNGTIAKITATPLVEGKTLIGSVATTVFDCCDSEPVGCVMGRPQRPCQWCARQLSRS